MQIELYVSRNGSVPFSDWINRIKDRAARAKIRVRLDRIQLGNLGDHKPIGDGVFEVRLTYGPGYRVYFGKIGSLVILLLCGGDKKRQSADIVQAKKYWKDYRSRSDEKNQGI